MNVNMAMLVGRWLSLSTTVVQITIKFGADIPDPDWMSLNKWHDNIVTVSRLV